MASLLLLIQAEPLLACTDKLGTATNSGVVLFVPILPLVEVKLSVVALMLAAVVSDALEVNETTAAFVPVTAAPIDMEPAVASSIMLSPEIVPLLLEVRLLAAVMFTKLPLPVEETPAFIFTLPSVKLVPLGVAASVI